MKKVLSIVLSLMMIASAVAAVDMTAYAGTYDTMGTAKNYTIGTSVTGYFTSNDDTDFIKFTLSESGKVSFNAQGTDGYYIDIYEPNDSDSFEYNWISYNSNLGKAYDDFTWYLVAGTYYLKLKGSSNNNYTISTSFSSAYESFADNQTVNNDIIGNANEISLGMSYNGMLALNDNVDFYKFTVSTGTYNIYVKSNYGLEFSIYTLDGQWIEYNWASVNSSTGYAEKTESISLNAGTYCLKICDNDGCFYSFSISSPHSHSYSYAYHVAKTYTSRGYDVYACSCGDSYATNYTGYKKLGAPSLTSVKALKKEKIKVSWKKKSGASGYQIYWAKDKSFKKIVAKKIVKGGKTTSYTGKNFTKGRKYYVKVRAYKTVNGKKVYGKWSSVKTVKAKK